MFRLSTRICLFLLPLISVLLPISTAKTYKFPKFTIEGRLLCDHRPISGNITMTSPGFFLDNILSSSSADTDGAFRLHSADHQQISKIDLIIEHNCHNITHYRKNQKIDVFTIYTIFRHEIISANFRLKTEIELTTAAQPKPSFPFFCIWKGAAWTKKIINDHWNRLLNLPIGKEIFGN